MKKVDWKFLVLIIMGFAIAMVGLISPPLGVISNSVLIMVGEFFVLAGGVIGCVVHFDFKNLYFHIGKMEKFTDGDQKPEKPEEE